MPLIFSSETFYQEEVTGIQFPSIFKYQEGNYKNAEGKKREFKKLKGSKKMLKERKKNQTSKTLKGSKKH